MIEQILNYIAQCLIEQHIFFNITIHLGKGG